MPTEVHVIFLTNHALIKPSAPNNNNNEAHRIPKRQV